MTSLFKDKLETNNVLPLLKRQSFKNTSV